MKTISQESLEIRLREIRHLLSHLHGEVTALEENYGQVLLALREMETAAETDDLTGLLRRNCFDRKWRDILEGAAEAGECAGLLIVDIDHFKRVNDTFGHPTGDEVIKKVAALLKQNESSGCIAGRLGGEEFALGIRARTDAEILGLAEMIRRGAERLHGPVIGSQGELIRNTTWKCTLSAGMASSSKVGYDAIRLLKAADEALYEAKKLGRNQVRAA